MTDPSARPAAERVNDEAEQAEASAAERVDPTEALDANLRESADAATKTLLDGVELTERELLKVLEKHGVKRFDPVGERFDPNLHQAMYEVPDASVPSGQVVQVV